ncbi:MAG: hypothetical protein OXR62_02505 [Ahrensia sp.]|nr:hypothetical protein [Ahrensia sp.]
MTDPVHEEEHRGSTIRIYHDPDAESPRDWDNLGTMVCGHPRYTLGDMHDFGCAAEFLVDLLGLDRDRDLSVDQLLARAEKVAVILPVYLYDHSGLAMNTIGFHCPWDSGQVGFIYVTLEDIRREYGISRVSAKRRAAVVDRLRQEVDTYSDYLGGFVYGYTVERGGEEIDSCWGFIGDYDGYCLEEARSNVPAGVVA